MYDKRRYFALAGLAACAMLAGCASTTEGTASFAGPKANVPSLPSGLPTGGSSAMPTVPTGSASSSVEPSTVPTTDAPATDAPTGPTNRKSGKVVLSDDGAICELISTADLKKIWGQAPRTFPDSDGPGCTYKDADGDQIIISEYYNLVASDQVSEDQKYKTGAKKVSTTVGGRPAVVLLEPDYGDGYWYVSETKSLSGEGVIDALLGNDPHLQNIAKAMLARIVPKYAH